MLLDEDLEVCSGARKGSGCGLLEYVVAIRTWTSWTAWYCEGSCIGEFFIITAREKKRCVDHELDKDAAKIMDLLLKHEWHKAQGG